MRYVRTTAPAVLPISVDEAKAQTIIGFTDDDALVTRLVNAVVSHLDGRAGILGRALINQSWTASGRCVPCVAINGRSRQAIPLLPGLVSAITSVKYYSSSVLVTIDPANYRLALDDRNRAYVDPVEGYCWPTPDVREDAWQVVFACGYGAAASDVPEAIRHGALMIVAHWYENREAASATKFEDLPMGIQNTLGPFKVKSY